MSYAELVCVSNFTFGFGASHPFELVRQAHENSYAAIAVCDECSMAGVVRAHETAKETGQALIIGSQFRFADGDRLVLLAPDHAAYTRICALITLGRGRAEKSTYKLEREDFKNLGNCIGLWVPGDAIRESPVAWFRDLGLRRRAIAFVHLLEQDSAIRLKQLQDLGRRFQIPLVAAGDVHYHDRNRQPLHDVITAVRLHKTVDQIGKEGFANGERFLRPIETLKRLYPQALLDETVSIANECRFTLDSLKYEYPHELTPTGLTASEHLRALTFEGAAVRWPDGIPPKVVDLVERELVLIAELGYEHFFLTCEDICREARRLGILCQGRGSAANSAVCYCLGVTEVDPSRMSMLMERFISKERAEPPDIDIDFEHQRREEIMQYVFNKYGRDRAALAATVITYRRKSAIRDVGKALGLPLDVVDAVSKSLYRFDGKEALSGTLEGLGFDPSSRVGMHLVHLVRELVGMPRHLSQHVGGFVISEHSLSLLVPVENAAMPDRTVIQWDKDDLEALGLLKVDCLALGMLSAIRRTLEMVAKWRKAPFRMQDIPAEDPATYDMLCEADSIGVFQVESRAQQTMLPRLKPRTYYDLVVETAIIRPGPIQGGMVHPFLRRRMGKEPVTYPSEALKVVLERTYGVPLFQEQVMQIAMVAAGFTAGQADDVRRSMAAWRRKGGLEKHREELLSGMLARGYTEEFAESIYQQILGFSGYGFPESHAASFALLAYASSWLKCHQPEAFLAGLLNSQPMGFYSAATLVQDAKRHGVVVLPVDVFKSDWDCSLEHQVNSKRPAMRLGFRQVIGLQQAQVEALVKARSRQLPISIADLAHRAELNRRSLGLLAKAGALESLSGHRRQALWSALGVERLPGLVAGHSAIENTIDLRAPTEPQDVKADYQATGLTLRRHPLLILRSRLSKMGLYRASDLSAVTNGRRIKIAGIVTHRQMPETASGVMFVSLEDETGIANLIVWKRIQIQHRQPLLGATLLMAEGICQNEEKVIHVVARRLQDFTPMLGGLQTGSRDFH